VTHTSVPTSPPDSTCRFSARNGTLEIKFKSHTPFAVAYATVYLERAQQILSSMVRGATDKLHEARRTRESDWRKLLASSLDAIVVAYRKIVRVGSPLFIPLKKVTVNLQETQKALTKLRRNDTKEPRELLAANRTRENDLRKLLANSPDAIVATNTDGCLVYANPKGLDLFGVSESNMRKFTIDAFLSHCQILELRRKWFAIRRDERYGRCKIRRLDGSSRVAEYSLVANIVPRLSLYRFPNAVPPGITPRFSAKMPISSLGNQFGTSSSEKFLKSSLL
jgi:PAS domain S-box-containing protein